MESGVNLFIIVYVTFSTPCLILFSLIFLQFKNILIYCGARLFLGGGEWLSDGIIKTIKNVEKMYD